MLGRTRVATTAGIAVLAFLAGASCASTDEEATTGDAAGPTTTADPTGDDGSVSPTTIDAVAIELTDEERTQLDDALGWSRDDSASLGRRLRSEIERAILREDFMVECMAAEGFEYYPLPQEQRFAVIEDPDAPQGTEAFTEKYGFGVSTFAFPLEIVGSEALGYDRSWADIDVPSFDENPNAGYYASLDEPGQAAYDRAIGGADGRSGCAAEAQAAVPDPTDTRIELADELEELDERVKADAEFVGLAAEIDSCMQVEGFTFVGFDELEAEIERRMLDAELVSDGTSEPAELPPDEFIDRLVEIQEFELALADEFERCAGGFEAWHDQIDAIAERYRVEFLATYAQAVGIGD